MHRLARSLLLTITLVSGGVIDAYSAEVDIGLLDAVKIADEEAVRAALSRGADIISPEIDGTTALHWAVHADNTTIVELLLDAGADANATNRYDVQPISLAATNGNGDVTALLLDAGANPNATTTEGETVLMTAARTGSLDVVRLLLEHGADVNAIESWRGQTALMWAAAEGHEGIVPTMLSHGADITARSTAGWSALLFAVREGNIGVVQTLLEAGADIEDILPVREVILRGATSDAGANITGMNVFLLAASNAHYELAALLVDRGADVNVAPRGWTALHQISWVRKAGVAGSNNPSPKGSGSMSSLDFVRKLVAAGADVNALVTEKPPAGITRLNFIGGTPFLLAARTGDADLMRVLAELGADPLLRNEDYTTPLMVAAGVGTSSPGEDPGTESEVLEAVKVALELGGQLDEVDDYGETVWHGAAQKHLPKVVSFLAEEAVRRGCYCIDVWNNSNGKGYTPLQIAEGVIGQISLHGDSATADAVRSVMVEAGLSQPTGQ